MRAKEPAYFSGGCAGCVTQEYVVNKYVLHVMHSFVLYPIVALFGVLIPFCGGGANGVHQSTGWFALSIPGKKGSNTEAVE